MKRPAARQLLPLIGLVVLAGADKPTHRPEPKMFWSSGPFRVGLDQSGLVSTLTHAGDEHAMNWVREEGPAWGVPVSLSANGPPVTWDGAVIDSAGENENVLLFRHGPLVVTLRQSLTPDAQLVQHYTLTNASASAITLADNEFGVRIPLQDRYADAATALNKRCNVHVWAGGATSWIDAERMSGNGPHLGLVLTDGELSSYAIVDRPGNSNDRGVFVLASAGRDLAPGASINLSCTLFWHNGWDDFFAKASRVPGFVRLTAGRYTVFPGESIRVTAETAGSVKEVIWSLNGKELSRQHGEGPFVCDITPTHAGEQLVEVSADGRASRLRAFVSPRPTDLIQARVRFILDHQQHHAPGQPTDGAFLPYDNDTGQIVVSRRGDDNAGRERLGMGVLLALYEPRCADLEFKARIHAALDRYWTFVTTRLQDADGKVLNGPDDKTKRLYNYPWVAQFHLAMYRATGEAKYVDWFYRTMITFYDNGGDRFYPIGLPIREGLAVLSDARRDADRDALLALFRRHADRIADVGTLVPKHEVAYEQSIVAPACSILLQTYNATGEQRYLEAARPLLKALLAFNGRQPDHRLNDIAIRHWDGYWFGKSRLYGDTYPHYWSTLSALVMEDWAQAEPEQAPALHARAINILYNNLSLFREDGSASCAHLYPSSVNGRPADFDDVRANDQDWALVHCLQTLALPAE